MKSSVAYIVFNRPEHTRESFALIREQQPPQLFIIADGPRPDHPTDDARCAEVRSIVDQVDWPCEVRHNYAEANLGLKRRVSSGLNWVFNQVDRAIVLEDDCVPHPDFFCFCDDLLERYADDDRVSVITGNNFQHGHRRGDGSYYFSRYNHCWGWATWRRAWSLYQGDIPFWPRWSQSPDWLQKLADPVEREYWTEIFDRVHAGAIDSWAYPWTASVWYHGGLTATPNVNLVSNIGFGEDATHTTSANNENAALPTQPLGALTHPSSLERDPMADALTFNRHFDGRSRRFPRRLLRWPRRIAGRVYRQLFRQASP